MRIFPSLVRADADRWTARAAAVTVLLLAAGALALLGLGSSAVFRADHWLEVAGGTIVLPFALWIAATTSNLWGGRCYFIAAIGFFVSAYSQGFATIPALSRLVLPINNAALLLFMGAFVALFLRFPRPLLAANRTIALLAGIATLSLAAIGIGLSGGIAAFSWLFSLEILAIVGLIVAQAWIGRHDARVRLRLGILSIVVGVSAALYLLVDILGPRLGAPGQFRIIIFPLNTLTFLGIGLAAGPVARFTAEGWIPRILLSLLLAMGTLLLDLLILMLVTRQEAVALGLAIGAVALVYVPLRLAMGQRAERRREARSRAIVELASDIAFATSPDALETRWHAAIQSLFDPKAIAPDDDRPVRAPEVAEEGIGLRLPAFQTLGPVVCRHADGGRRLFSAQDAAVAGHLARLLDQLIAGRDSYVRGIETERQRIARDLHDDVNGLLLAGLLRDDPETMRSDVRSAISEIRSIVRGANESNRSVGNLIAEMRQEAAIRLEAAGVALDWQVGEIDDTGLLAYPRYRHVLSIVREGITNILRHAGAGRVQVHTLVEDATLALMIADDGQGIAPLKPGNGLTNCKRRAELVGGTFAAVPGDHGFTLRLRVPIGE